MCDLMRKLGRAANQGVPLVAVRTADQPAALRALAAGFSKAGWAVVSWDVALGLRSVANGDDAVAAIAGDLPTEAVTASNAVSLSAPEKTAIVLQSAHRALDAALAQALLNARDPFARTSRMAILLGPSFDLPSELGADVYVIDDALPDEGQRTKIAIDVAEAARIELDGSQRVAAIRSTRGLSAFAASQVLALSANVGKSLDLGTLHSQWREAINSTPGLSVDTSGKTLADVAGLDNFKSFASAIAGGNAPPDTIVRLDEVEKAIGSAGDSSGVSQGILGAILTWLEEHGARGLIALGPPGSGKSLCSVATGAACGAPTVTLDLGALKGSLVGQSEERTRNALRALDSLAGSTFWIATCNNIQAIPPELRRRFSFGVWFFDLPDAEEREALWRMYTAKCGVPDERPASDAGWSGAEIRNVCEMARDLRISPRVAAQWIVPAAISSADAIEALRRSASGKYLSASKAGAYSYPGPIATVAPAGMVATRTMGGFES